MNDDVMTVRDLAERLDLDPSSMRRVVMNRGLPISKVRRITDGGMQLLIAIPKPDALTIINEYVGARSLQTAEASIDG